MPGYFPSRRNVAKSEKTAEGLKTGNAAIARYLENLGIVQNREGGGLPFMVDDFWSTVWGHVDSASALIHYAEPVRSAELVLAHPEIRSEIAARLGERLNRGVSDFLVDASMVEHPTNRIGAEIKRLSGNVGKALTQTSWKAWLRNSLGVVTLAQELDARDLAAGIAGALKPGAFKRMIEQSPDVWHRYYAQPFAAHTQVAEAPGMVTGREARALLGAAGKSAADGRPVEAVRVALRSFNAVRANNWFDSIPIRVAYAAAENIVKREEPGLFGERRVAWVNQRAQEIIRRTANTYSRFDRSGWAALVDRHQSLTPFIMFKSDASKRYNQGVRFLRIARQTGKVAPLFKYLASAALGIYLSKVIIGAGGNYVLDKLGSGDSAAGQEIRKDRFAESAARGFLDELAGTAFMADAATSIGRKFAGMKSPTLEEDVLDTALGGATNDVLASLDDIWKATDKALQDEESLKRGKLVSAADLFYRGLARAGLGASSLSGVPAQPIADTVRHISEGGKRNHVADLMYERRKLNKIAESKRTPDQRDRLASLENFYSRRYSEMMARINRLKKQGLKQEAREVEASLEARTKAFMQDLSNVASTEHSGNK